MTGKQGTGSTCKRCGAIVLNAATACPNCGNTQPPIATIVTEQDAISGDVRFRVNDQRGARSEAHGDVKSPTAEHVTVEVSGTGGLGEANEQIVAESVWDALRSAGVYAVIEAEVNADGEDRIVGSLNSVAVFL